MGDTIYNKGDDKLSAAERFKRLRKDYLRLSQSALGERLGVKRDVINNIENERTKNPERYEPVIRLMCNQFNVNEHWLRTGEGDMFVQLSRDEKIATFIGNVLSDESDTFKKRFISMLSKLHESEWELLEKMVEGIKKD